MANEISVQMVPRRMLAAVRRRVRVGEIEGVWRPALDKVWEFLRQQPGLCTDGHTIFVYHHQASRELTMEVDFGVEVARPFEPSAEVRLAETPAGKVASALHVGPYDRIFETHAAIHVWAATNHAALAGCSWENYGDWTEDVNKLETLVLYLLDWLAP